MRCRLPGNGRRLVRSYNGVDQYGSAPPARNPLAPGGATTFLFRVKGAAPGGIVTLGGYSSDTANAAPTARVYIDTGGIPHLFSRYSTTIGGDVAASAAVMDGAWHSGAVVDDGGSVQWYVDGAAAGSGSYVRQSGYPDPDLWTLAAVRYSGTTAQYAQAQLAEWAELARAISADEVARWHAGTLDLSAYGEDRVLWDWQGYGGADTAQAGTTRGAVRQVVAYANMTDADLVVA